MRERSRAALAIVRRKLDRGWAFGWSVRFVLAFLAAVAFGPLIPETARFIILTTVLPLANATQSMRAQSMRRTSLFAMPLYGKQLARALALSPALTALAVPAGFLLGLGVRASAVPTQIVLAALCANVVGALVAIGAVFRDGANAWLYYALTGMAGAAIAAPFLFRFPTPLPISLFVAVLLGFIALRAFGETLARYDPLPA